jgi:hypothetical protein
MKSIFTLLFLLMLSSVFAQDAEWKSYVVHVDSLKQAQDLKEKKFKGVSFCGGELRGYFLKSDLIYIHSVVKTEMSHALTEVYLRADTMVFVRTGQAYYTPEKDMVEYCKTHKTKKGDCDYSALPKTVTEMEYWFGIDPIVTKKVNGEEILLSEKLKRSYISGMRSCFSKMWDELMK